MTTFGSARSARRRFARYVALLSACGVMLIGAVVTVNGLYGAVPIGLIGVLYISANLGRSIGWPALLAPVLTAIVWFVASVVLITAAFDGPDENEAEGWSVLFTILGVGFALLVAEAGVIAGLVWRASTQRRPAAAPRDDSAAPS